MKGPRIQGVEEPRGKTADNFFFLNPTNSTNPTSYSHRWVIEEFFRNAKQLTDMEGATIRTEQGVSITICLVSWIDSLLHFEAGIAAGIAGRP
ncbi:hypothetical protein DSCO28_18270 [Desulfosarcina ovata subsp. sediminis]|uniref:Transposase IS4-like domain-containing protein n=1 Tax=Desulfosarcina ovata subsp. sediminis TaxID=885957 RepID=A0A5K7ZK38_9BACT|nr:hypothetical protein DSCO28_18270 [Desulfosarcina ovata subsp. sediminis]